VALISSTIVSWRTCSSRILTIRFPMSVILSRYVGSHTVNLVTLLTQMSRVIKSRVWIGTRFIG
jgi:hypothetical protein